MAVGRILGVRKTFEAASVGMLEFESDASEGLLAKEKTYKDGFKNRPVNLRKYLWNSDSKLSIVSSSPKVFAGINEADFGEEFYIHEDELDAYCQGFAESIIANIEDVYNEGIEADLEEDSLLESALDDEDVKLSLYRSFKSLYDKWISTSDPKGELSAGSGFFYNNYDADNTDGRTLFEHFNFVNRTGGEIGGKAVIDIAYLSNLSNTSNGQGPTQSLYNSLTNLLSKNNFDFFAMPNYVSYSEDTKGDEELKDMWRPITGPLNPIAPKPAFICMFIGGSSRALDIPRSRCGSSGIEFDYKDDSFDIGEPSEWPEDLLANNGGITAFKVRYGQEAQNHFKSIQLDQAEFKETQESLLVIDALTNPKTGSNPSQIGKGNNLYDTYLTRSYSCDIETFGNFQIQPLMYYKLENVPMFRGTYMIINVSHSIEPHNAKTTFKGVRQPIIQVPLVTDALSLLDLALTPDEAFEGDRISLEGSYGTNNYSGGQSANNLVVDNTVLPASVVDGIEVSNSSYTPNANNSRLKPDKVKGITMHWTAGWTFASADSTLQQRGKSFGYHYIAHEDGRLISYNSIDRKAWHGGCGSGANRVTNCAQMNSISVGISYVGGVEKDGKHGYYRTWDEWQQEDFSKDGKHSFKSKKQWESLVNAVVLSKKKYPNITWITSHHWTKRGKIDVGDKFPWDKFLAAIKAKSGGWTPKIVTNWKGSTGQLIKSSNVSTTGGVLTALENEVDETNKS